MSNLSKTLATVSASVICAHAAMASPPEVATDLSAVHGLVARVMDGIGVPGLLVQHGASPHGYVLRPSNAAQLEAADVVFQLGSGVAPALERAVSALAHDARVISLAEVPGTILLRTRTSGTFEAHDHSDHEGHDHDDHDNHDHSDHADHKDDHDEHESHAKEEGHDHEGHDHDDHDSHDHSDHADHKDDHDEHAGHEEHGAYDPHVWLDPENAQIWLGSIAQTLSELDPENADRYAGNANAAMGEIGTVTAQIRQQLDPYRDIPFIVFHDAYQYYETRFGLAAAGSISLGDAADPSAARVSEIQSKVSELGISCVFSEPQFNPGLVRTVLSGSAAKTGILDPLGSALEPGPGFYPALMVALADQVEGCLK